MTRLILAAGVAALAIATPAAAKPGGGGGGGNPHGDNGGNHGGGGGGGGNPHGGGGNPHGGGGGAPAFNAGGGGGHGHSGGGGGGHPSFSFGGGGGGGHGHGGGQQQARAFGGGGHGHGGGNQQARAFAQHGGGHGHGGGNQQARTFAQHGGGHGHGGGNQQARAFAQHGGGGHGHGQQARAFANNGNGHGRGQQLNGFSQQQGRGFDRKQAQVAQGEQFRGNGNGMKGQRAFAGPQFTGAITGQDLAGARMNGKTAQFANQQFIQQNARPYAVLSYGNNGQVLPVTEVTQFVGQPISVVPSYVGLSPLPATLQYLYPSTPNYYYQYGGGYLYQVDRTDNLIAALIPLLAGGFLPGQYLPQSYMASYAPDYYGYDAFYPADYGYGDLCNRYEYGVIYQVDCYDGMVENVIPVYAGGYGVGQLLPTAYRTYNVPMQYRSMYYNTADAGYRYAPGAIYQYDPRSSVITSVATLMSPGFSIGQPLPIGYSAYNVPLDYRATYYDTPTAWYRYNNGYIYQVDPTTQLVTAIVASLLT